MNKITKLKGYDFWKSIGSPKYFCAPMVAQSELAFRILVSNNGCDICYSPMVMTSAYLNSKKEADNLFKSCQHEKKVIVQIAGNDKEKLLKVSQDLINKYNNIIAFDLNLGCPQLFAGKNQYGAYMLDDPIHVSKIIQYLDENLEVPIFIKIRVQKDDQQTLEMVKLFENFGAQCITVHGRTKENIHDKIGKCNWEIIKKIKNITNIPIIANGGIMTQQDIQNCFQVTNCDAVMSAEALLENPGLFNFNANTNLIEQQKIYIKQYLNICKSTCCQPNRKEFKLHLKVFFHKFLKEDAKIDNIYNRKLGQAQTIEEHIDIANEILLIIENNNQNSNNTDINQQKIYKTNANNTNITIDSDNIFYQGCWYNRHKYNNKKKFAETVEYQKIQNKIQQNYQKILNDEK